MEQIEIAHADNVAARAFEVSKSLVTLAVDLTNSRINIFNINLERYKAKAVEVTQKIEIEKLKIEHYRAELGKTEMQAGKDSTVLADYQNQIANFNSLLSLFEAEGNKVKTEIEIEKLKLQTLSSEVELYGAKVEGQKNEYQLYEAQLNGEQAKVNLYTSQVQAYNVRNQGIKTEADIAIAILNGRIATEELNLKGYVANLNKYRSEAENCSSSI